MSTTAKEETLVLASSLPRLTGRPLDDFPSYVSIINAVATGINADEGYVVEFKALAASMQAASEHITELKELLRKVEPWIPDTMESRSGRMCGPTVVIKAEIRAALKG
jgi:hypothetical protein